VLVRAGGSEPTRVAGTAHVRYGPVAVREALILRMPVGASRVPAQGDGIPVREGGAAAHPPTGECLEFRLLSVPTGHRRTAAG
jgi:hypothetical protein